MIVRVESVLAIGILLVTCLSGTSGLEISPSHLHSAPNKPVTFTCTSIEAVAACEFLVRYNNVDLAVIDPFQASSGSLDLPSSGRQSPPEKVSSRAAETAQGNQQSVTRQRGVDDEPAAPVVRPGVNNAVGRTNGVSGPPQNRGTTYTDARVAKEEEALRIGRGLYVGSSQPPGFDDRPAWTTNTRSPITNEQGDESASVSSRRNRNSNTLVVLKARDASRGAVSTVKRPVSPYPANDVQCSRRQHGWKNLNSAPARATATQLDLRPRLGDDGYRWRASAEANVCKLNLPEVKEGLHLIGCRARKASGGWEYATASMDVNRYQPLGLTSQVQPIVSPNSRVNFTFKSANSMTLCLVNRTRGVLSSNRVQCLKTVLAASGPVWYTGVQGRIRKESKAAFLRVRTVPTRIELAVPKTKLMEGEFFTTTCTVGVQQPEANISWYLGDEQLRADANDDFADSKWVWPWEGRSLRQSLSMALTTDDDKLQLTCQVDHPSLTAPLKQSVTMHVTQDDDDGTEDCGTTSEISPRLMGGSKATVHVPWVAAIYRRMRSGDYEHVCGGTLVSRRLVVSSAQCFWDATFTRVADPSLFRVALGRSVRMWKPSDLLVQSPGIARLAVPKHFLGRGAHYAYDIAVLVLDSAVTISDNVLPACVDRAATLRPLQPGDVGSVSGWGITESGRLSPTLRSIELPYVDIDECYRAVDTDLHRYISYDKFCAGYRNQTKSVCPGDSGGGLVFLDAKTGRHYLRGVASVGFAPIGNDENCFADLYTGFTLVSEYVTWIFKQAPQPPVAA